MASIQDRRKEKRGIVVRFREPSGRQSSRTFRTMRDAREFAASVETDKLRGLYVSAAGGRTKFSTRWAEYRKESVDHRASTKARNETYYRVHIEPTFGHRSIGDIDRGDIASWVAELTDSGLAPATVRKLYQLVARVLEDAVAARLIASTPCVRIRLPKDEHKEQRFLTPDEVSRLAATIDERFRLWVLVAAYSGLRAGELFGLRRSRLDLTAGRISVVEQVVEVGGSVEFSAPKTAASRREVPIPRFLCDELLEWTAGMGPSDLVFPAPSGGPVYLRKFRQRYWIPATTAAGLGAMVPVLDDEGEPTGRSSYEGLRIHDLRHTAVTFWIAAKASPKEVAARAGHRSVVTVLDRYGHLLPSTEDSVTDALDAMARGAAASAVPGEVVEMRPRAV